MKIDAKYSITGGGIAGLGAAEKLIESGENPQIFEATKYIGGRIRTEQGRETGARFIHDKRFLPVLERYGLAAHSFDENSGAYLFDAETGVFEKDVDCERSVAALVEELRREIRSLTRRPSANISSFTQDEYVQRLARQGQMNLETFLDDLRRFNGSLAKRINPKRELILRSLQAEYGAGPEEISIQSLCEQSTFNNCNYLVEGGFSQLPQRMAEGLEIQHHTPVHRIDWSKEPIVFHTSKGKFRTQKAIITVPLGILQEERLRFYPELPKDMQKAIRQLGNATICEIIYECRQAFWPEDMKVLRTTLPYSPILWPNESETPSLTCYVGGPPSRKLQKMESEQAVELVLRDLVQIFGKEIRSLIYNGKRVAWNNKYWKRTGYSFKRNDYEHARSILSQPIGKHMILAGEAYIADETASTVYGGYLSGRKAAEQMLR